MFLTVSALLIIHNNNLALIGSENLNTFIGLYFEWLESIYGNIASVVGYLVKFSWLPH